MFKSMIPGITEWTPWSELKFYPSDVAFTLYGVPTPGALALLGVAGLAARRRRA